MKAREDGYERLSMKDEREVRGLGAVKGRQGEWGEDGEGRMKEPWKALRSQGIYGPALVQCAKKSNR